MTEQTKILILDLIVALLKPEKTNLEIDELIKRAKLELGEK